MAKELITLYRVDNFRPLFTGFDVQACYEYATAYAAKYHVAVQDQWGRWWSSKHAQKDYSCMCVAQYKARQNGANLIGK